MGAKKREELVFDSDSEVQFASDSNKDFTHDFSEDRNGTVEADEEWHKRRGEDKVTVHHLTGLDPGLICVVAHDINGESSSFAFYR
jgi:hypothetical protein